jgi:hypothetical protein
MRHVCLLCGGLCSNLVWGLRWLKSVLVSPHVLPVCLLAAWDMRSGRESGPRAWLGRFICSSRLCDLLVRRIVQVLAWAWRISFWHFLPFSATVYSHCQQELVCSISSFPLPCPQNHCEVEPVFGFSSFSPLRQQKHWQMRTFRGVSSSFLLLPSSVSLPGWLGGCREDAAFRTCNVAKSWQHLWPLTCGAAAGEGLEVMGVRTTQAP